MRSRRTNQRRGSLILLSLAVAPMAWPTPAGATTDNWNAFSGNWATADNWTSNKVPGAGDIVDIGLENASTFSVTYNYTGTNVTLNSLTIDMSNTAATASLVMSAGTLLTLNESVGYSGAGTFNQSGGFAAVAGLGGSLYVGNQANSTGTYILSGSGLLAPTNEYVGYSGNGVINQSGGTNGNENIYQGFSAGSMGDYVLSGGTCTSTTENVGYSGNGVFDQLGGVNTVNSQLNIGVQSNGANVYILVGGAISGPANTFTEYIGDGGVGTFDQGGGSNSDFNTYLGYQTAATGTFNLSAGTCSSHSENIGYMGQGIFNQTGGTNSVANSSGISGFLLGYNSGSTGTYILSGGALIASSNASEFIGFNGTGIFNQSAGSNTVGGFFFAVGYGIGSSGTYNLSGGTLSVSAPDGEVIGEFGSGTFNQTGGTHTITGVGGLTIGQESAMGAYILSNGSLSVTGSEYIGDSSQGIFNQTGGTNTVSNSSGISGFLLGCNSGSTGTYNLGGGALIASSDASEFIGFSGTGTFNQSAGSNIVGGFFFAVAYDPGSSGTYNLTGGTLSASAPDGEAVGEFGDGTFNQTGGTNTVTGVDGLTIGQESGMGSYILSNGSLSVTAYEIVGDQTIGIFNQSGGSNTIGGDLHIGEFSGATGTYTLSAGTLSVGGGADLGKNGGVGVLNVNGAGQMTVAGTLQIYPGSPSVLNLSGGSITAASIAFNSPFNQFNWSAGRLLLTGQSVIIESSNAANFGDSAGTPGSFALGAGQNLDIPNDNEFAGYNAVGSINQSGGSNTVGDALYLGYNVGSTGTYALSGTAASLLIASAETVGNSGVGTFNQTGGVNVVSGPAGLSIAALSGSTGSYTVTGGTLIVDADVDVGGASSAAGGHGTLTVSNTGQFTDAGTLRVWGQGTVIVGGTVATVGGLAIATGGIVNINSALLIAFDDITTEAQIQSLIEGKSIVSTFDPSQSAGEFGIAYADGSDAGVLNPNLQAHQIIVEPDLLGDADLNGTVNFHDLQDLLGGFGGPGFWDQGNFNNHPTVDFNDLQLLLGNFNHSTSLSYSELASIENLVGQYGEFAEPNADGLGFSLVAVPEPAAIVLCGVLAVPLLLRRRRKIRNSE